MVRERECRRGTDQAQIFPLVVSAHLMETPPALPANADVVTCTLGSKTAMCYRGRRRCVNESFKQYAYWICMYIRIYVYVCMYVYIYACVYVCMHVFMYILLYHIPHYITVTFGPESHWALVNKTIYKPIASFGDSEWMNNSVVPRVGVRE